MRTVLKIASILTWFNLVAWGFVLLLMFAMLGVMGIGVAQLLSVVLVSSVPLSSYAALQLHKSIRRPTQKLSSQAPVGIRFVGLVGLFLGFQLISIGANFLVNTVRALDTFKDISKQMPKAMAQSQQEVFNAQTIHSLGGFFVFLGLCVCVNFFLNIRLLRWYYLVKQSDVS